MTGGTVTAKTNAHPYKDNSYALNAAPISITGGSLTAQGATSVCSRTTDRITLGDGVTAFVSNDYNGSNLTEYKSETTIGAVKYFRASKT